MEEITGAVAATDAVAAFLENAKSGEAKPLVVHGMPFSDYRAVPAVCSSDLKKIISESAADLYANWKAPSPPTDNMKLGTLFHALTLEPWTFSRCFAIMPEYNLRTKAGRADRDKFEAANSDKIIITNDMLDAALGMREGVLSSPYGALFDDGHPEVSIFWLNREFKIPCKARIDWVPEAHNALIDLKKTGSLVPHTLVSNSGAWGYGIQDHWYRLAAREAELDHNHLLFAFALDHPRFHAKSGEMKHPVVWHYMDHETRRKAAISVHRALEKFANCKYNNEWPGYDSETEAQPLTLPSYYF